MSIVGIAIHVYLNILHKPRNKSAAIVTKLLGDNRVHILSQFFHEYAVSKTMLYQIQKVCIFGCLFISLD